MPNFRLINKSVALNSIAMINQLPCDGSMEVVVKPYVRKRRDEANALMWIRLAEIADQAWVAGRQYSSDILHEWCKAQFLPEAFEEGITLDGYQKYAILPDGSRTVIGSTTRLTTRGFANYLTQVEQFGASLGVQFSAQSN